MHSWFRSVIRGKTRVALAWIFAALLIFSARTHPTWPGIVLCFNGALLRFWASGYLRKDTALSVAGPYAFVRNPLYLGTFLMALGTALAIENLILVLVVGSVFGVIYHCIILDEEVKLSQIFGEPYAVYCKTVPRFFPRLLPANWAVLQTLQSQDKNRFSFQIAWNNKAYEAFAAAAALIGFVTGVAFLWQKWVGT